MTNGILAAGRYSAPTTAGNPPIGSYTSREPDGKLRTFKGRRVEYKDNHPGTIGRDGTWRRIWFPNGPPTFVADAAVEDAKYTNDIKQSFETLRVTGSFPNNEMPELPPKAEWVRWDF